MSEEINKQNIEDQPNNAAPAENGDQAGKMFTQDEVNKIVSDRLARDREKRSAQQQEDTKELALKARESKLDCREYLSEKKYPAELLEVLDTSDVEKFKATADKIQEMYGLESKRARFVDPPKFAAPRFDGGPGPGGFGFRNDPIRDAFKPKA